MKHIKKNSRCIELQYVAWQTYAALFLWFVFPNQTQTPSLCDWSPCGYAAVCTVTVLRCPGSSPFAQLHTHTHTLLILPSGLSSLLNLTVSAGRSQAHGYRAQFDYVLIQSAKAERATLIFETQNNAYWAYRHMSDPWTRLSLRGNIILVTEHV